MKELSRECPSVIFSYQRRAEQLFNFWNVAKCLGIEGAEKELALKYTTERFLRVGIYESSEFLHRPFAISPSRLRRLDSRDRDSRKAKDYLEENIDDLLASDFQKPEERIRARTIELALNDLVARATPDSPIQGIINNLSISKEDLEFWAQRWQPQLQNPS